MKIATWNVNSLRVRLRHVLTWLDSSKPDIAGLQETKLENEDFPLDAFEEAGYRCLYNGQKTYNGVALLSRERGTDSVTELPGLRDEQCRVVGATFGDARVINLYVPNGKAVGTDKFAYKLEWLDALGEWLACELSRHRRLLVMGDYNIAPEDRDVHDPKQWQGTVLCSEPERQRLKGLQQLGLADTFRLFDQPHGSFSWWDYRAGAFRRNRGLRIDLLLASDELAAECTACRIDREPRGWERPSDHAPVWAEFRARVTGERLRDSVK